MHVSEAYNAWAATYDSMDNKTRDLELLAARQTLQPLRFGQVLELGCGTGKNTGWLAQQAHHLVALDFSEEMLQLARQKVTAPNVAFLPADLNQLWPVPPHSFHLVSCSLVLEHIAQLDHIFAQAGQALLPGGIFYLCELHPYRQYQGKGANFETARGEQIRPATFVHHLSDYTGAANRQGFLLRQLEEWFDGPDRSGTPRLVSLVLERV